jgi:hypothetical protein
VTRARLASWCYGRAAGAYTSAETGGGGCRHPLSTTT